MGAALVINMFLRTIPSQQIARKLINGIQRFAQELCVLRIV